MDDFFSESKPDLINKKILYNFEKMLKKPKITDQADWSNLIYFYEEYIKPNIFFIIVIILLTLFLIYRYITKSNSTENLEQFSDLSISDYSVKEHQQDYLDKYNEDNDTYHINNNIDENELLGNDLFINSDNITIKRNIDLLAEYMFGKSDSDNLYSGMQYSYFNQ